MSLNLIPPTIILNNADISINQTSIPVHIMYTDNIGIHFVWTGTPTGTFGVQICNDASLSPTGNITGGNWVPLALSAPGPSGAAGKGFIDLNQTGAAFIQVYYTAASGSGHATVTLTGKSV